MRVTTPEFHGGNEHDSLTAGTMEVLSSKAKQKQQKRDVSPRRARFRPPMFTSICHNTVFCFFGFFVFFPSTVASKPTSTSCIKPGLPTPARANMNVIPGAEKACRTVDVLAENMKVMLWVGVKLHCGVFQALGTTAQLQEPHLFKRLFFFVPVVFLL